MAWNRRTAKPGMATLRGSSVRETTVFLVTFRLVFERSPSLNFFLLHLHLYSSPEPHILLFRRPLGTDPQSGRVDPELERKAREDYRSQYGVVRK
jgi:hypothetical protein